MADRSDISSLTLQEKAALGGGADMWRTKAVGDLPAIALVDGPHGVRMPSDTSTMNLDPSGTLPATCFPPAVAVAQTWSPALARRVGEALGAECRHFGVDVLLGPAVNIKRDPRCGRNFEYFSEDPLLTGALGVAWVDGLQSTGVGASLKHFAANNTETDRMRSDSDVDMRTLREIYLRAFQRIVEQARPWTVMCSYNRINGVPAPENHWLLTEVLRGEWGFDGVVVSDWGAVSDRPSATAAGLDLEMPGSGGLTDADLVAAVESGAVSAADVDRAAARVARLVRRASAGERPGVAYDADAHHALAREVAAQAIVLLQNEGDLLPLGAEKIAVLGEFAQSPVYQGGGSSHVVPSALDIPLEEIRRRAGSSEVTYAPGFSTTHEDDGPALREDAARQAADADVAVVFLGVPSGAESEGWDREHIDLPAPQLDLLRAVAQVQPRVVAVLSHGGVVRSGTVAELAPAVVDGALLGQAGGGALADVLFGRVNPSGRLAETVPQRLSDAPSYLNFPGESRRVRYGERVFVGYRGYDAAERAVAFPFGHGLSYTTFEYHGIDVRLAADTLAVGLTVTNTGPRQGREVVQVYAGLDGSRVSRPPRWLVGFGEVILEPGESLRCTIDVGLDELAYWNVDIDAWTVEEGEYTISVGASSRDLRLTTSVPVVPHLGVQDSAPPVTLQSTLGEALAHPRVGPALVDAMQRLGGDGMPNAEAMGTDLLRMMAQVPLDRMVAFSGGAVTREALQALLQDS